mgnify:CR=1 FL=1
MRRWARSLGAAVAVLAAASGCSDPGADRAADVDPVEVAGRAVDRQADGGADAPPLPSRGCAAPVTDPASLQRAELSSRGVMREYFLTTPGGDEPLPLVVDLHGLMEGAQLHARHTALGELGLERGFVTVFPHGRGDPVRWDTRTGADDNADLAFLDAIVERSARLKLDVCARDPFESGERRTLNLGHTLGHAVELASGFTLRHGEAVAIGLVAEARLAERLGLAAEPGLSDRLARLLARLGLPVEIPPGLDREALRRALLLDKKNEAGTIRFALPIRIGEIRTRVAVDPAVAIG